MQLRGLLPNDQISASLKLFKTCRITSNLRITFHNFLRVQFQGRASMGCRAEMRCRLAEIYWHQSRIICKLHRRLRECSLRKTEARIIWWNCDNIPALMSRWMIFFLLKNEILCMSNDQRGTVNIQARNKFDVYIDPLNLQIKSLNMQSTTFS